MPEGLQPHPELANSLALAESRLQAISQRALNTKTWHASQVIVRELVQAADELLPIISDFEQTDSPYEIARNNIAFLTTDETSARAERINETIARLEHTLTQD